jgi:hypothetical protein
MTMAARKPTTREIGRDAGTGEFIPVEEARRRPKTTVVETIPIPKPAPKKGGGGKKGR